MLWLLQATHWATHNTPMDPKKESVLISCIWWVYCCIWNTGVWTPNLIRVAWKRSSTKYQMLDFHYAYWVPWYIFHQDLSWTPTLMRTATWPSITWHLHKNTFFHNPCHIIFLIQKKYFGGNKQFPISFFWSQKKMCKVTTYTSQSRLCLKVLELGEPVKNARFEEIDVYQQPFFDPSWDSDKALKL